jgi:hypothetical protein
MWLPHEVHYIFLNIYICSIELNSLIRNLLFLYTILLITIIISTIAYYYYYHRDMGTKISKLTKNVIFDGSVRCTNRSQTHESGRNHTLKRESIVSTRRTVYLIVLHI